MRTIFLLLFWGLLAKQSAGQILRERKPAKSTPKSSQSVKPAQNPSSTNNFTLKVTSDMPCKLFIDTDFKGIVQAGAILKINLIPGEYLIEAESIENAKLKHDSTKTIRKEDIGSSEIYFIRLANSIQQSVLENDKNASNAMLSKELETNTLQKVDSSMIPQNIKRDLNYDGNTYNSIKLGKQEWMSENLSISVYRNGDKIAAGLSYEEWNSSNSGAWAYYKNDESNGRIYGKLYNWYAVSDPRGLCPTGWHVPSDSEWLELINFLGGQASAGGKLKSTSALWKSPNKGATNSSSFAALPGGYRDSFGNMFDSEGSRGRFWSSTEFDVNIAYLFNLYFKTSSIERVTNFKKSGYSVRCIKD